MGKKKDAALHGLSKAERKALEERERVLAAELAKREAKAAKKAAKKTKPKKAKPAVEIEPVHVPSKTERDAKSPKAVVADAADKALATPSSDGARQAAETAAEAAAEADDTETDEQIRARVLAKRAERAEATKPIGGTASSLAALNAIAGDVDVVETEKGREFAVGRAAADTGESRATVEAAVAEGIVDLDEFAKPSEAPRGDFEVNGNGQYKIKRLGDGKIVGYTRATTYIANLEDRSNLEKWKLRMLLEGVAVNDTDGQLLDMPPTEPVVAKVRDLTHRRDVAIAKARKADRKGKLATGELATYVEGAWSDFKRAVNELAESLLDLGGAHEKATKGTDIHALCELHDREGIDAVAQLLTDGKISPADFDDVAAYADAIKRAGIRIIDIERCVVNEERKVAGRLDRVVMAKFPGMTRAIRCVLDIKTGRIDLGPGKLAQQLEMYASSEGYDLDTHEREDLKLSRTKALVLHLPAGTAKATIHPVDLVLGRKGNALSGEVRAWRNEGKRALDLKTDLAAPPAAGDEDSPV